MRREKRRRRRRRRRKGCGQDIDFLPLSQQRRSSKNDAPEEALTKSQQAKSTAKSSKNSIFKTPSPPFSFPPQFYADSNLFPLLIIDTQVSSTLHTHTPTHTPSHRRTHMYRSSADAGGVKQSRNVDALIRQPTTFFFLFNSSFG